MFSLRHVISAPFCVFALAACAPASFDFGLIESLRARNRNGCANVEPDYSHYALRRMSRAEFRYSVQDLFEVSGDYSADLPLDSAYHGFTNVSKTLSISPVLIDRIWTVSEQITDDTTISTNAAASGIHQSCTPSASVSSIRACAEQILTPILLKAYRRPPTAAELTQLSDTVVLVTSTHGESFAAGLRMALRAVLLSPKFFMRDEAPSESGVQQLNDYALAARLASFLWKSVPDDELLLHAANDDLDQPAVLEAQINRMVANSKFDRFVDEWVDEWLLHEIDIVSPSVTEYPTWNETLRTDLKNETRLFVRHLVNNNLPISQLLEADFSFVNNNLAGHYGLASPGSSSHILASLPAATQRRGILTQGAFLTQTASPTRGNPIKRGLWVLEKLTCSAPQPPPPDVETTLPDMAPGGGGPLTMRERLAHHRAQGSTCIGCHFEMDPIGLGLENFDGVGRWIANDENGFTIEPHGELVGTPFSDHLELGRIIQEDPRFENCVSQMMTIGGLGHAADIQASNESLCTAKANIEQTKLRGGGLMDLLKSTIYSPEFIRNKVVADE